MMTPHAPHDSRLEVSAFRRARATAIPPPASSSSSAGCGDLRGVGDAGSRIGFGRRRRPARLGTPPISRPNIPGICRQAGVWRRAAGRAGGAIGPAHRVASGRGLEGGSSPAPEALRRAMSASLASVAADALPKDSLDADKVILVEVSTDTGGYEVAARELDVAAGLWSGPVARPLPQLVKLPDACSAAVFAAFSPLARLQRRERPPGRVALAGVGPQAPRSGPGPGQAGRRLPAGGEGCRG